MYGSNGWGKYPKHGSSLSGYTPTKRCHDTHPPLKIGGGTVYGGSCHHPNMQCDYHIALDGSARLEFLPPWEDRYVISFPIVDMSVPKPEPTKQLVAWIVGELAKGKSFHIGCFAGHGRTGTILAAIVKEATGEKDAITWLRTNYCKKAVESASQIDFLQKHFGVKKVKPSKESFSPAYPKATSSAKKAGTGTSNPWYFDDSSSKTQVSTTTARSARQHPTAKRDIFDITS